MKIGVIGGSGLYEMDGLTDLRSEQVTTPFGDPSDVFMCGSMGNKEVCFLPRHGKGHRILPSEINHKANIFALKKLGVERVISVSAVGSLKEENRPRDIVFPDQYFDRTKGSLDHTFFGEGLVGHVSFGEPTCADLRSHMVTAAKRVIDVGSDTPDVRVQAGGTYINMEGHAFSTKAESHAYRKMGFDIIGMTSLPEAKLCRESEMCYQAMSMVTDYDCWHESDEPVSAEMVIAHLVANTALAKKVLADLIPTLPETCPCACSVALKSALVTDAGIVPESTKQKISPIIGKYMQ